MKKLTQEEWQLLVNNAHKLQKSHPHLRIGQIIFNTLYISEHYHLAEVVRGTHNDPFYASDLTDERMVNCYNAIVEQQN